MTKENGITAGAVSPSGEFSRALEAFLTAVRERTEAAKDYKKAEAAYIADVNDLPVPELMQGPVVLVTDADSIEKARVVLSMSETGPDAAAVIEQRIGDLIRYREARASLAQLHKLDERGNAALEAAHKAQTAQQAVIDALPHPGAPSSWEEAVRTYECAWAGWDALGEDHLDEECNAVSDLAHPRQEALLAFPAPDGAALLYKLRVVVDGDSIENEVAQYLLADAERLFGGEARS